MSAQRRDHDGHEGEEGDGGGAPRGPNGRRRFLTGLTLGLGAAVGAVAAAPLLGMLLSPLRRRRDPEWVSVGPVESFERGRTVMVTHRIPGALPWAGASRESAAWLRRDEDDRIVVLSAYCTHVGCPTRWVEPAALFLCPCHGGAFFADGAVAAGPPPRPLPVYPVRVRRGHVEVLPQPLTASSTV